MRVEQEEQLNSKMQQTHKQEPEEETPLTEASSFGHLCHSYCNILRAGQLA